jgi:hypothetical protein
MYYTPTPFPFSELLIIFIRPRFLTMQSPGVALHQMLNNFLSVMNMCSAKLYDMSTMKLCTAEYEKFNDMMNNLFAIRAVDMQTIMGYPDI